MYSVNLKDAETQLTKLVEDAARGEDVSIRRNDGASFQLVPLKGKKSGAVPSSEPALEPVPKFGSTKGLINIADNFDEPIEGFEAYAP